MNLMCPCILELPKIHDERGNLTVIEGDTIPFAIRRVYYLYDVEGGAVRAGHAHKTLEQFLIAVSGSFDVAISNGKKFYHVYHLNRSHYGLYVPPMYWRVIDNFSSGAVCLVLASAEYDELDYYREYADYLISVRGK